MQETMFPMSHKLLSPKHVQPVVDEYITLTHRYLEERANQYNGLNITLKDFIVPLTFEASAHAFFGEACPVGDLLEPFKVYDNSFHLFLAGVPKVFMNGPVKALHRLATIIDEGYLSKPEALDDASDMIKAYDRITRDDGFVSHPRPKVRSVLTALPRQGTREAAPLVITFLWALMANAPLAAYWIIALNLQRQDGLKPFVAEVDKAVANWNATNPTLPLDSPQRIVDFINQADFPLLNSTIQETLRFTTSTMSIRAVKERADLGGFTFHRGEEIVCMSRMVHLDPEIHERPDEYIPTRYMTETKFTKDGKPVMNHTIPFGGGVSMCEGR